MNALVFLLEKTELNDQSLDRTTGVEIGQDLVAKAKVVTGVSAPNLGPKRDLVTGQISQDLAVITGREKDPNSGMTEEATSRNLVESVNLGKEAIDQLLVETTKVEKDPNLEIIQEVLMIKVGPHLAIAREDHLKNPVKVLPAAIEMETQGSRVTGVIGPDWVVQKKDLNQGAGTSLSSREMVDLTNRDPHLVIREMTIQNSEIIIDLAA